MGQRASPAAFQSSTSPEILRQPRRAQDDRDLKKFRVEHRKTSLEKQSSTLCHPECSARRISDNTSGVNAGCKALGPCRWSWWWESLTDRQLSPKHRRRSFGQQLASG